MIHTHQTLVSFSLICCASLFFSGCGSCELERFDESVERDLIMGIMANQEAAWNVGDLDGFMEAYWKSDSLLFVGSRGPTRGWSSTLENYRKGYPDRTSMGKLSFGVESLEFPAPDVALMLGSWKLEERGELKPLSGWFSLVWQRMNGAWVIVRDHSS